MSPLVKPSSDRSLFLSLKEERQEQEDGVLGERKPKTAAHFLEHHILQASICWANQIWIGKWVCGFLDWEQAEHSHKAHFSRTQAMKCIWPEKWISLSMWPQNLLSSSDLLEKRQRWCLNSILHESSQKYWSFLKENIQRAYFKPEPVCEILTEWLHGVALLCVIYFEDALFLGAL